MTSAAKHDRNDAEPFDIESQVLRSRLAAAEAQLREQRRTRLGMVARLVRAALKDPSRRRTFVRDVGRALVDKSFASYSDVVSAGAKYPLPNVPLPDGPVARPGLRVAVIVDPFTELALCYEWQQIAITPDRWREQLNADPPKLLFVESAWRGNSGAWRLHMTRVGGPSAELRELVAWCKEQGVPTVFWNKEDPPNYERFIETAKLFDHVFTVDADRIPEYRHDLGHERVGILPFAAQPRIHNPIQRGPGRIYDVAFAGSYFADKHPERRAQMGYVLEPALDFGLHIYSRLQDDDDRYRFPPAYRSHIVGSLPYEQMLTAYASYKVFLNVNSVTTSRSMCARRLFELSAAQTAVITAPAESVEPFFGDDVEVVRNAEEARQALATLIQHDEYRDRLGLRAHRRVFDGNLYTHRVDTVLGAVGLPASKHRQAISVVVPTNRPSQLNHVLSFIGAQRHPQVQLVLVQHGFTTPDDELMARAKESGVDEVVAVGAESRLTLGACMNLGIVAADGDFVAKMDDDNFYGAEYLSDLVRAFSYTDAEVVGKWAHLVHLEATGATLLRFPHAEHRYVRLVQGGTLLMRRDTAATIGFENLPRRVDTTFLDKVRAHGGSVYSTDRFNFVSIRRANAGSHTWKITEKELLARKAKLLFYGEPYAHAEV